MAANKRVPRSVRTLYDVLEVEKAATQEEIKSSYRTLAKKYHPDTNPGDKKAEERFKEIAAAYAILGDPKAREQYDRTGRTADPGPVVITAKTGRYAVQELAVAGEIADIYQAIRDTGELFAFKIARSHKDNDLLENEARVLKEIYPTDTAGHKYHMYLPRLVDSLKVDAGARRQANVLEWLQDYYSLERVRAAHPKLQMEHGVWMFNRILEILGYVHTRKLHVHGAVLPQHVLVYAGDKVKDPLNHGARLVGWSYAVPREQTLKAISPQYEHFYPPEVFAKKPATPATDIYMAAKSIIHTLGGDVSATGADRFPAHLPDYFINFLRGCTLKSPAARPQDAWALHQELKEWMQRNYGPKKYVPFHMPLPV